VSEICRCICYAGCAHEPNECDQPGGGHRSQYFCAGCDPRRIADISAQLESIVDEFRANGGFQQAPDCHELKYRAGSRGLGKIGIPDVAEPHWYCTCGRWVVQRDLQGRPFEETAKRRHRKHAKEASDG
jgi:hypothetical protein